ncbi:MAG: bacillithiol biosynthesis BshC, partial [Bacteroidota bacterium]
GLSGLCDELSAILGESGKGLVDMFKKAYQANNRLADATRFIFNSIFGSYGLLIVDGDDVSLKKIFASHILLELQEQRSAQALEITNRSFAEVGKLQINPRPINLFYMLDGFRERLEPDGSGGMKVLNSDLHFSKESLVSELNQHPERFSPNVTLRPLYQETILPNLAYIGGPGELNYWLQLKGVFESFGIFYPMVLMRSSFTLLDESTVNRIAKLGISNLELFKSKESLLFHLLERTGENIDVSDLNIQLNKAFDALKEQWLSIDATLEGSIEAERAKAMKSVQSLEEKARRALKRKHETLASQISKLKELVAPEGSPQERTDSFIGHDLRLAGHLIQSLLPLSSPFESVHLVVE